MGANLALKIVLPQRDGSRAARTRVRGVELVRLGVELLVKLGLEQHLQIRQSAHLGRRLLNEIIWPCPAFKGDRSGQDGLELQRHHQRDVAHRDASLLPSRKIDLS